MTRKVFFLSDFTLPIKEVRQMSRKKNITLITVDCLRPDHLNCYGYPRLTSPFISLLARKGLMFTNIFSNSSYTCASVASMITSTYPFDYGEYLEYSTPARLSRKRILLSEVLKAHGYSTAFFHDNPYLSPVFGYNRGFDLIVDLGEKGNVSRKGKQRIFSIMKNEKIRRMIWRIKDLLLFSRWYFQDVPLHADAEIVFREAYKWTRKTEPPYFLWIHLMDVHVPYCPRHKILNRFGINKFNVLRVVYKRFRGKELTDKELEFFKLLYDVQVYQVDYVLAKYLPRITGEDKKNSYVILTADHGENLEDKKKAGSHSGKLTDKLLHVPLIISGGKLKPKIMDVKASLIDLAPTILDLLGIDKPKLYKGESLLRKNRDEKVFAQGIFKGKRYQRII